MANNTTSCRVAETFETLQHVGDREAGCSRDPHPPGPCDVCRQGGERPQILASPSPGPGLQARSPRGHVVDHQESCVLRTSTALKDRVRPTAVREGKAEQGPEV